MNTDYKQATLKTRRTDHMAREIEQLKKKLAQAQLVIDFQKKSLGTAWDTHPLTRQQRGELMELISQRDGILLVRSFAVHL